MNVIIKLVKQIDEESYFLHWYDTQPVSAKIGFYGAVIIALLTHAIMYSTLILEHHLPGFSTSNLLRPHGRWFHYHVNSLTFFYMNWVTGLLQVLFLALISSIVIKAFNIQNRLYALLIAGILVTFPAIAETNLFYHDAAPYFFAALLSIMAFHVTQIYKFGWIAGIFLIMLGLAIYQSKISLAMVASLIYLVIYVFNENPKFTALVKYSYRYLMLIAGGLLAYYISLQILNISLDYRGMGDLSLINICVYNDILRAYREVYFYFFSNSFRITNHILIFSYGSVAITTLLLLVCFSYKKIMDQSIANLVLVAILVLLLPLAANFSRILDNHYEIGVLRMTSYAFAFFLILPLILFENFKINTHGLKKLTVLALVFIIGYYVSFSNYIYFRGQVYTTHAMKLANRITARIEPLLAYSDANQVFILGNLAMNPLYPHAVIFREYSPRTVSSVNLGGENVLGHWLDNYFGNVIRYRIGLDISHVMSLEKRRYLQNRAITYGMPVYPQEGSVTIIDGTVVAMLNFFGRVDIEEVSPNKFLATIHHTGKTSNLKFEYVWYLYRNGQRVEQIYIDSFGKGYLSHEIFSPGSYQFRVFTRLLNDRRSIINNFSPNFEVEARACFKLPAVVNFGIGGNAFNYIVSGFSNSEDGFRWTEGNKAVLRFPVNDVPDNLIARFDLAPLLRAGILDAQHVEVFVNGEKIADWELTGRTVKEISLSRSLLQSQRIEITFLLPDAASPKDLGINDDPRKLAVAFRAIHFDRDGVIQNKE